MNNHDKSWFCWNIGYFRTNPNLEMGQDILELSQGELITVIHNDPLCAYAKKKNVALQPSLIRHWSWFTGKTKQETMVLMFTTRSWSLLFKFHCTVKSSPSQKWAGIGTWKIPCNGINGRLGMLMIPAYPNSGLLMVSWAQERTSCDH